MRCQQKKGHGRCGPSPITIIAKIILLFPGNVKKCSPPLELCPNSEKAYNVGLSRPTVRVDQQKCPIGSPMRVRPYSGSPTNPNRANA